jgi:ubiquinone/menaquinone biosynthesis C-methylase UbiE
MNKETVLDIGIGEGGKYISQDSSHNILRIGLDLDPYGLELARQKILTPLVKADATMCLPFKDKSFSRVEIIFPFDELLVALTDKQSNLCTEIQRITKNEVLIILDTDYFWRQGVYNNGKAITLDYPHELIADNLKTSGLLISEFDEMTIDEVQSLGTDFSESISQWMQLPLRHKAYKITASVK